MSHIIRDAIQAQNPEQDVLAKRYPLWRKNCLESMEFLSSPQCTYSAELIEKLMDYYEQKATIYWCLMQKHPFKGESDGH